MTAAPRCTTLALTAALLAAAPAAARGQSAATRRARPATASLSAAPRAPGPVASPARATALAAPAPDAVRLSGAIGLESSLESGGETAFKLQVDAERDLRRLGPAARAAGVLSLGFTTWSKSVSEPITGTTIDTSSQTLELVPAFRFGLELARGFEVHGDTGLGVAYATARVKTSGTLLGSSSASDSTWGSVLRFAAGASYDATPQLRVGASLGLDVLVAKGGTARSLPVLAYATWRI